MCVPHHDPLLAVLVIEQLQVRTLSEDEFTAYDVTRAIRKSRPNRNIPHASVRALAQQMNAALSAGLYQATLRRFGGRVAILYRPVVQVWPGGAGIPGLPLLPLN